MKTNIKVPYALKKLALGAAVVALPVFTACEKDKDPIQERIEQLTAMEKVQANEVRAAVQPAVTQPLDISNNYWSSFDGVNVPRGTNLLDSARVHIRSIGGWFEVYPNSANKENLTALYNKCKTYMETVEELNKLKAR